MEDSAGRLEIGVLPQLAEMKSADEDWSGISDAAARRRLQNRLNQRAKRKRAEITTDGAVTLGARGEAKPQLEAREGPSKSHGKVSCSLGNSASRRELLTFADNALATYRLGIVNTVHLPDVLRFNIFHALAMNAISLSLTDDWLNYEATSEFGLTTIDLSMEADTACPPSLKPTLLQYTVRHHPWIDLLPCPRLRDNFLGIIQQFGEDAIDEDKLCQDVIEGSTRDTDSHAAALIVWGNPWEVASWEVSEEFVQNWGCLLHGCKELLESTNVWRGKRGLPNLTDHQKVLFLE